MLLYRSGELHLPVRILPKTNLVLVLSGMLFLSGCVTDKTAGTTSHGTAGTKPVSEYLDRYYEAACDFQQRDIGDSLTKFEALKADGFEPAADVLDALDTRSVGAPVIDQDSLVVQRAKDAWKDAMWVPPSSAGNNALFQLVQALPPELNSEVADWIKARHLELPPSFMFEAGRRIAAKDVVEGYYWITIGLARLRFEIHRFGNDPSLGDLPIFWGGIIAGRIRTHVGASRTGPLSEEANERLLDLTLIMHKQLLENWEILVPVELPIWSDCHRAPSGDPIPEVTLAKWRASNDAIRTIFQRRVDSQK